MNGLEYSNFRPVLYWMLDKTFRLLLAVPLLLCALFAAAISLPLWLALRVLERWGFNRGRPA